MSTLTNAQKRARQREYSKAYYYKKKAETNSKKKVRMVAQQVAAPLEQATQENGELIHIINAYYVLHSSVKDGQIRADLNKVLAAIIIKNSN